MTERLTAELIETEADYEALTQDWWDLWHQAPAATPFQTPAWLIAWWRAFHPGRLAVLAVRSRSRLVGLAPFYLETTQAASRLLPIGIAVSDYLDVLVAGGMADEVLVCMSRNYAERVPQWREWELPHLGVTAAARRLPMPPDAGEQIADSDPCPVLALGEAADADLPRAVPSRMRRKHRMAHHRLQRRGYSTFVGIADRPAAWWAETLVRLVALRRAERDGETATADPRLEAHYRDMIDTLAPLGIVRAHALIVGGEVAGAYLGFLCRGRAMAYLGGFDGRFAEVSPGTVLIGTAILEAVRNGASQFDFLRGREAYKYAWGARDEPCHRRVFTRSSR